MRAEILRGEFSLTSSPGLRTFFYVTYFLCRFGSQRIGKRTGILFNDEMNDFLSPEPTTFANRVEPGKRPQSSMCPAIIVDARRDVVMVIGGSGSARITSATTYVCPKYCTVYMALEL